MSACELSAPGNVNVSKFKVSVTHWDPMFILCSAQICGGSHVLNNIF